MNGNTISISGNLASDPELKYTPTGTAVATLNVGVSERKRNSTNGEWEDSGTSWFRVIVWGDMAINLQSFTRGSRVMVTGTMRQRSYETKEGETRTMWELTADDIGLSARFATVQAQKTTRSRPTAPDTSDPWAAMPEASRERPAEPPANGADAKPGPGSQSPAEPATVATGADTPTVAKRARKRPASPAPATAPATAPA